MKAGQWTVRAEWLPLPGSTRPDQTALACTDQPTAERAALHLACLAGARYVAVAGPGDTVTLDWDRYTNKARRYGRYLGVCGNEVEHPDGTAPVCTGEIYAPKDAVQARCFECGAWDGVLSPPRRPYWEALGLPWPHVYTVRNLP